MLHKISFTLSLLLLSLYPSVITLPSCLDGAGGWQIRIATTRVSLRGVLELSGVHSLCDHLQKPPIHVPVLHPLPQSIVCLPSSFQVQI